MVQNLINRVKAAETEADKIVFKAQDTKKNLIEKAQRDAVEFKKSIQKEANQKGNELFEENKRECETLNVAAEKEAKVLVDQLLAKGVAMEDKVVDEIIDYIFN